MNARAVVREVGVVGVWIVTGAVLKSFQPCPNILGNGKRPVAVRISDFDFAAGTDPIVEEDTTSTVDDFIVSFEHS